MKFPVDPDKIKNTADDEERKRLKAINGKAAQEHLERIRETKNLDPLDLRMRGTNRLASKEYRTNLPVGRYRLTFTASALNRDLVKQVAETSKKGKAADLGTFRELYGAKAGLAILHGGINKSPRGAVAAHSKKGKLLHYFEIEDNEKRQYNCEFELAIPGQIEMDFVNGPWSSRLNRINLGGLLGQGRGPGQVRASLYSHPQQDHPGAHRRTFGGEQPIPDRRRRHTVATATEAGTSRVQTVPGSKRR